MIVDSLWMELVTSAFVATSILHFHHVLQDTSLLLCIDHSSFRGAVFHEDRRRGVHNTPYYVFWE